MIDRPSLPHLPPRETQASPDWTLPPDAPGAPPTPSAAVSWPWGAGDRQRYAIPAEARPLGEGGMGSVWRVWDLWLGREVAMKVIHRAVLDLRGPEDFVREARVVASLHHPAILPLLDVGVDDDSRGWYTMPLVQGSTLEGVCARVIAAGCAEPGPRWRATEDGWTLRGLLGAFITICDAIAYAHARGVLHLDLKPRNVMVGAFGQVTVVDWGLTRTLGEVKERLGGTPEYMAPEIEAGDVVSLTSAQDSYALGVTLRQLLGDGALPAPDELWEIARDATAVDPSGRPGAAELARRVRVWLDGDLRREQADQIMQSVRDLPDRVRGLREEARRLEREVRVLEAGVPRYAPIDQKRPLWAREDEARATLEEADKVEIDWQRVVFGALNLDPDQPEAHARLAEHHRARHAQAERDGDRAGAMRALAALEDHDRAGLHRAYRAGLGRLRLETEPAGAQVFAAPYVEEDRRLIPGPERALGRTPIGAVELPAGRWLLTLRHPGHETLRLPVLVPRGGCWEHRRPGAEEPRPLRLLPEGALDADEVYVPEGLFRCGGDPRAPRALPADELWLDAFILKRHPVTCQEYCEFLNDLARRGRGEEAEALWPGDMLLPRAPGGGYQVGPDPEKDPVDPARPVTRVSLACALAFAGWLSERTGRSWRVPGELALEKAARGTDGRLYPWGDTFDASWCNMSESRAKPQPMPVHAFPTDESPWGARGMAGNVICWSSDPHRPLGPERPQALPPLERASLLADARYTLRGSSYTSADFLCRSATRYAFVWSHSSPAIGIRLAREG